MPAKPKYHASYAEKARKLCVLGATDELLAEMFDVHVDSIRIWKTKHPAFGKAVAEGKLHPDMEVAQSLLHMATGYEYAEEVAEKCKDKHGNEKLQKVTVYKRQAPHPTSAMFWLQNRRADLWRHASKIDPLQGGADVRVRVAIEFVPGGQARHEHNVIPPPPPDDEPIDVTPTRVPNFVKSG